MKKTSSLVSALLLAAAVLAGCATHSPIQQPNPDADMHAQMTRQTVDGVMVMARPVHVKSELKSYFDEDLVLYGVLPFHVGFKNLDGVSCRIEAKSAALAAPDGSLLPP